MRSRIRIPYDGALLSYGGGTLEKLILEIDGK
jgi:hypothetical protein